MRRSLLTVLVAQLGIVSLLAQNRGPTPAAGRDRARIQSGAATLYDTAILHRIDVVIAPADADKLIRRTSERIPCTFTFDGRTLTNVGVRQSGGIYHGYVPIGGKPSLSVKFDEFAKGQLLFGLDKLILKNELQDLGLASEHLTYHVFRRAGLAAPLTAHARVTINGIDSGIYLMREPVDKEFFVRNFGKGAEGGNLYEIENTRDFVLDPNYPALDDEGKNGRNRRDLVQFAAAIRSATPESFVADVRPYLDIDRFVTFVAAEMATGHWDGLTYRNNNTYVYARPSDGKFIFIPYGADQTLGTSRRFSAWEQPQSSLVRKLLAVPALAQRVNEEVARISREPVWNQQELLRRLADVGRILSTAGTSGRTGSDVSRFAAYRQFLEQSIQQPTPLTAGAFR